MAAVAQDLFVRRITGASTGAATAAPPAIEGTSEIVSASAAGVAVSQIAYVLRQAHKLPADAPVPADLVFTSASGLDPHISPEGARFQIGRVAEARGAPAEKVGELVERFVEPPQWGIFGQARVNVLRLNLALDREFPAGK